MGIDLDSPVEVELIDNWTRTEIRGIYKLHAGKEEGAYKKICGALETSWRRQQRILA